jgi:hypothetical protein
MNNSINHSNTIDLRYSNITQYFELILNDLSCGKETKAYIISIYAKYKNASHDLSKDSLTLLYAQATNKQDFSIYQNLGDWIFVKNSLFLEKNENLKNASKDYYDTLGRLSYYSCYRLINKQWHLFEELADNFVNLENQAKKLLKS